MFLFSDTRLIRCVVLMNNKCLLACLLTTSLRSLSMCISALACSAVNESIRHPTTSNLPQHKHMLLEINYRNICLYRISVRGVTSTLAVRCTLLALILDIKNSVTEWCSWGKWQNSKMCNFRSLQLKLQWDFCSEIICVLILVLVHENITRGFIQHFTAYEVKTLWRDRNVCIIIISSSSRCFVSNKKPLPTSSGPVHTITTQLMGHIHNYTLWNTIIIDQSQHVTALHHQILFLKYMQTIIILFNHNSYILPSATRPGQHMSQCTWSILPGSWSVPNVHCLFDDLLQQLARSCLIGKHILTSSYQTVCRQYMARLVNESS